MRYIDIRCPECGAVTVDHFQRNSKESLPLCAAMRPLDIVVDYREPAMGRCGGQTIRHYLPTNRNNVIGDEIPGGVLMHNALCNSDGTPRRYDSRTEINREAKKRGYENHVQHIGQQGSDKSKHTTRWV